MTEAATGQKWDAEYRAGRYQGEPPIPFVETILENLDPEERDDYGLYVGCGNGRNYLPLVDEGLKLHGMDVSAEGIRQLRADHPETETMTFVGDFGNYSGYNVFGYLIAIQVFQHGDRAAAVNYFRQSASVLKPGGKLFLRVNSVSTELLHEHRLVEGDVDHGKTIAYEDGPKQGLDIHFYSRAELQMLARRFGFRIISPIREVTEEREPPQTGTWSQWETIWQREAEEDEQE